MYVCSCVYACACMCVCCVLCMHAAVVLHCAHVRFLHAKLTLQLPATNSQLRAKLQNSPQPTTAGSIVRMDVFYTPKSSSIVRMDVFYTPNSPSNYQLPAPSYEQNYNQLPRAPLCGCTFFTRRSRPPLCGCTFFIRRCRPPRETYPIWSDSDEFRSGWTES